MIADVIQWILKAAAVFGQTAAIRLCLRVSVNDCYFLHNMTNISITISFFAWLLAKGAHFTMLCGALIESSQNGEKGKSGVGDLLNLQAKENCFNVIIYSQSQALMALITIDELKASLPTSLNVSCEHFICENPFM